MIGLRWHIVQKTLPQSVKERAMPLACAKKPARWRLDVQQPPWFTFVAGWFFTLKALPACKVGAGLAVWGKFWLRRMGNEYFAIDRE